MSVNSIVMAEPSQRLAAAKHEGIVMGGSAVGAEIGVGLCLAFGIASGGWGLLACGLVGGAAGGISIDRIVYPNRPDDVVRQMQNHGKLDNPLILR